ncbi:ABC transporter ATP-binding protein [Rothia aerolata]|uniref:ABC transporter ATP-binding protein n=1 Tax=Rothia aerolata TaxID=1812262 RepID=A0A917ISU2_9MICC|nr:ABC transporter ATP-binding protein [Rothia aerolata]GGH62423.1 ABC transporter ATP-binding protein [Rothia aerolata]
MQPAGIEATDFGWHHPGRAQPAFSGLNFVIEPGQKVLLLGASGAGKSTLLHAMAGVIHDDDGETQLGSLTVGGLAPAEARGVVGLMQQDPESSVVLARVGDDVAFGPENLGVAREEIWRRVEECLRVVGLEDLDLNRSTSALSGGQKQRLGLAGILVMHPGALLLDEPTANLDPAGVEQVRRAVLDAQAATGATLVVIEHRVGIWAEHMDRVIVLGSNGGITHDGAPETVLREARAELIEAGVWVPDYLPQTPQPVTGKQTPLVSAQDLSITRAYPSRKQRKQRARDLAAGQSPVLELEPVAQGISLQVLSGEHLSILGPNGAGKSTLALTLAGLLYPVSGRLEAEEPLRASSSLMGDAASGSRSAQTVSSDIASWQPAELASRIGLVFQEPEQQFIRPTVREELEFGPRQIARIRKSPLNEEELAERTDFLLQRLRLDTLQDANPFTLSGGEKRRLSVASALTTAPAIVVLDEPTFGQDAKTWAELVVLIRELVEGGTAVISITHDMDFVRALGGRAFSVGGERAGQMRRVGQL